MDMHQGLDSCPEALIQLLKGENKGKVIVNLDLPTAKL